ncbi:MAG: AAA family ATPase [Clostridia bacterium]|nr:AAA family ATPase [Clostridia bacterium]
MKIERIEIDGFGCHRDLSLSFREDFNLLCGKNESGKSTVLAFIETLLYGFEADGRNFWRPWNGGPFGGTMTFTHDEVSYKAMVSWGTTPEEDRITVTNQQTDTHELLPKGDTIGLRYLNLPRKSFRLFTLGLSSPEEDGEVRQLEGLTQKTGNGGKTAESQSLLQFKNKLADEVRRLDTQKGILRERSEKRTHSECEAQALEAQIEQLEQQHTALTQKEGKSPSMEVFTASVSLLEKQKKAERLRETVEIMQQEYVDAKEALAHKKRPWIILLIVLLVVDFLTLIALFLPETWLPTFLPLSTLSADWHLNACFMTGGLFFVLSLALILVATGGRSTLLEAEETLSFKEQALWDLLGLNQPSYEEMDLAMLSLSDRCKSAAQCVASMEKERQNQAEVTSKASALAQQITYSRAQLEMLRRFMGGERTAQELEAEIAKIEEAQTEVQKHITAVSLGADLLQQAQYRKQWDLGPRLSGQTGTYLGELTSGRYDTVELSRVLEPQVRVGNVVRSGKHYSGATGKQLNLSVKLAEIKWLAESGQKIPLILDEPMAVYDEERRSASLETLLRFAKENDIQIILTSSQTKASYVTEYSQYALSI